jgi:hypothetical protein
VVWHPVVVTPRTRFALAVDEAELAQATDAVRDRGPADMERARQLGRGQPPVRAFRPGPGEEGPRLLQGQLPGGPVHAAPLLWLTFAAALPTAAGLAALRRRDIG